MPRAERWSGEPPPTYAEVRPCADPNDAGTAWRAERLKDLAWRAKCLRVHDTPEIQEALAAMRASTAALDEMAVAQSSPTYERPWWPTASTTSGAPRRRTTRASAVPRQEVRRGVRRAHRGDPPRAEARDVPRQPRRRRPQTRPPPLRARRREARGREGPEPRHRDAPRREGGARARRPDEALALSTPPSRRPHRAAATPIGPSRRANPPRGEASRGAPRGRRRAPRRSSAPGGARVAEPRGRGGRGALGGGGAARARTRRRRRRVAPRRSCSAAARGTR